MSKPTFTDEWRRPTPYATAAESREPGYLKRRFEEIRTQARIARELAELRAEESNTQRRPLNRVTPLRLTAGAVDHQPAAGCVERKKRG